MRINFQIATSFWSVNRIISKPIVIGSIFEMICFSAMTNFASDFFIRGQVFFGPDYIFSPDYFSGLYCASVYGIFRYLKNINGNNLRCFEQDTSNDVITSN